MEVPDGILMRCCDINERILFKDRKKYECAYISPLAICVKVVFYSNLELKISNVILLQVKVLLGENGYLHLHGALQVFHMMGFLL